jgi:hypothetical protein
MLDKLKQLHQMKQQMDAAKERLNHVSVKGEFQGVTVVANGNKKITEIIIPDSVLSRADKSELPKLLIIATNNAIQQAENVFETEMRFMAGGMMSGLGLS